jgi:hypothetical protein
MCAITLSEKGSKRVSTDPPSGVKNTRAQSAGCAAGSPRSAGGATAAAAAAAAAGGEAALPRFTAGGAGEVGSDAAGEVTGAPRAGVATAAADGTEEMRPGVLARPGVVNMSDAASFEREAIGTRLLFFRADETPDART